MAKGRVEALESPQISGLRGTGAVFFQYFSFPPVSYILPVFSTRSVEC